MNWIKPYSLVDWLWVCFLNYKISLFGSIKLSCNSICLQWICQAKFFIYLFEHCVKRVQIRSYLWSVFPVFELNTGIYGENIHIQSKHRKIRTRNNSVFGRFSGSKSLHNNRRSSSPVALKNRCFSIVSGKHLCQSLLF